MSTLAEQRLWGTVLAAAVASRGERVLVELAAEASGHLSEVAFEAAKAAAAIMAMNNIYYRSKHLLADEGEKSYETFPPGLRMQVIGTHGGVDPEDFESGARRSGRERLRRVPGGSSKRAVREPGVGRDMFDEALRIASVVHAVAVTLESEQMIFFFFFWGGGGGGGGGVFNGLKASTD